MTSWACCSILQPAYGGDDVIDRRLTAAVSQPKSRLLS